jgi:hypothetical protein
MSSKAAVYSIKDKTCGIWIILEHQIYSYSGQFYIINLSQGIKRIRTDVVTTFCLVGPNITV